jgi:hypothetical protein
MIGVCGFGYTGSSAVIDFLKEYTDLNFIHSEFPIVYRPDGFLALENYLFDNINRFLSSDYAISRFRFMVKTYINELKLDKKNRKLALNRLELFVESITQVKWYSPVVGHKAANVYGSARAPLKYYLMNRLYNLSVKLRLNYIDFRLKGYRYFSVKPDDFLELSKKFISDFLEIISDGKNRNLVLDQPFSADNTKKASRYFDNPKVIVVDRDPRDLYIYAKIIRGGINFIPTNTVEDFVLYYKKIRETYLSNGPYDNKMQLYIFFEDLIYRYEETTDKIIQFLGLNKKNFNKTFFNPKESKRYTKLYLNRKDLDKDLKFIEESLSEFLYKDLFE